MTPLWSQPAAASAQPRTAITRPAWAAGHPADARVTAPRTLPGRTRAPRSRTNPQLIQDPGFEAGPPWLAWTQQPVTAGYSTNRILIDNQGPHTGSYSAHLCQNSTSCDDAVTQQITVPNRILSATLSYSFRVVSQDPPTSCADSLSVGLTDTYFNSTADSGRTYCPDWNGQSWTTDTIDETSFLQGHANQTVDLVAVGVTDGDVNASDFNVDDFTLSITYASGPADPFTAVSRQQYSLAGSDGVTWTAIDPTYLALTVTPLVDSDAIMNGNADLWTSTSHVNQDIGIAVSGGTSPGYPTKAGQPEAWKESGGSAGTFSPNAAFVQTVVPLKSGATYTVKLVWKTNYPTAAGIFAAAGPSAPFSPTRLSVQLIPSGGSASVQSAVSKGQFRMSGSNGTTWTPMPPFPQPSSYNPPPHLTLNPPVNGTAIVGANADLWTANAGINQDLGISENGSIVAWKESGGFAGTFSPNAAFVQAVVPVTANTNYDFNLFWKANHVTGGTIFAGAGPINGDFSPTSLTVQFVPYGAGLQDAVSTSQYQLSGSDGVAWSDIDPSKLSLSITPPADCTAVLSGNVDLWTVNAGYNQDVGIQLSWPGYTLAPSDVGWKESGGFAGTFSPNAAFVKTLFPMAAGVTYTAKLQWKTNKPSPSNATIVAGASPSSPYSPTWLTAQLLCPQKLAITTAPQTLTAGNASSPITIQLQDAWGNPVSAANSGQAVNLASSSTTGNFNPPSPITIAAGSNSASFTYTDTTRGTPTISATASGLTGGSQQETVNPASASSMTMSAPPTATHGIAFNVTITLKDQYGNVASGYRGTVKFASSDAAAMVNGTAASSYTYAFLPADAGTHIFSVTLNTAAPAATLTATDTLAPTLTASTTISVS